MQGKTHMMVGVSSLVCMSILFPKGININGQDILFPIAGVTAAIGSYLPDIDIQQSKLGQKYRFISKHLTHRGFTHTLVIPAILLVALVSCLLIPVDYIRYINLALLILCTAGAGKLIFTLAKTSQVDIYDFVHGVCMGYAGITLISDLTTTIVCASIIFGLLFGWLMHILADMCNGKGVPLLPGMPHVHIMSVVTGTWQESLWACVYMLGILLITAKGVLL